MVHLNNKKIQILKPIPGFSIIEVLVSLAIVSFSVLMILVIASNSMQKATANKIKLEMLNSASTLIASTKSVLYNKHRYDNWGNYLNGNIMLSNIQGSLDITHAPADCSLNDGVLSATCPNVGDVINNVSDFLGYLIITDPGPLTNTYNIKVIVACKQNTRCNPELIKPATITGLIVKY